MEERTRHPAFDPQHEILERYCRKAEEELAGAPDLHTALQTKDRLCSALEMECASTIIVTGTRAYIEKIIADRWGVQHAHAADNRH